MNNDIDKSLKTATPFDPDPDWVKDEKKNGDFEGEAWLSTDGKHTVRVLAKTPEGREKALIWAKDVYEAIRTRYGTKQGQAVKEYGKEKAAKKYVCSICGQPAEYKSGVKNGKKWAGVFCTADNTHVKWVPQ